MMVSVYLCICVPVLLVFLALVTLTGADTEGGNTSNLVLQLLTEQIGIGVDVGIGLTAVGSFLISQLHSRGWNTVSWRQLLVIALALTCFALVQILGGSGFITGFAGGLLFSWIARKHKHIKHALLLAAEGGQRYLGTDHLGGFWWLGSGSGGR